MGEKTFLGTAGLAVGNTERTGIHLILNVLLLPEDKPMSSSKVVLASIQKEVDDG